MANLKNKSKPPFSYSILMMKIKKKINLKFLNKKIRFLKNKQVRLEIIESTLLMTCTIILLDSG